MAAIELRQLKLDSLPQVTLRAEDMAECFDQGTTPEEAIRQSVTQVEYSYAIYASGELIGFCGYKPDGLCGPCDIWLLTTPAVERHKLSFVKFARHAFEYLHQMHQLRTPAVSVKYAGAIKLAQRLGFRFGPERDGFICGMTD